MKSGVTFGIAPQQLHAGYDDLLALWKLADDLGYDCGWMPDHFLPLAGDEEGPYLEEWTTITALAMQTGRMRVGPLVLGNTFRNPGIVAKMGAALDIATGGRLEMGLGAAWFQREHRMYGIPFPPVSQRIAMLGEALQVIRRLWTEPRVDFQGKYYTMTDAVCQPRPVQRPHPTLWVGGAGERRTLRVIARYADGWNCSVGPEEYAHKLEVLKGHCDDVGTDVDAIRKSIYFVLGVHEDGDRAREIARETLGRFGAQVQKALIAGTPGECVEQIRSFVDLGVSHFIVELQPPYDHPGLQLLAEKVMPQFR